MPIDTRDKRSSAINIGSPWRSKLPAPDGTVRGFDKAHALGYYGALLQAASRIVNAFGYRRRRKPEDIQDEIDAALVADRAAIAKLISSNAVLRRQQHFAGVALLLDL